MGTTSQTLVENEKINGRVRSFLIVGRLREHNQYVYFTGLNGETRIDDPRDFDVFDWNGDTYEVQGYDAARRRWWVEKLPRFKPDQTTPSEKRMNPLTEAA